MLKLKMMLCGDDVAGRRRLYIKIGPIVSAYYRLRRG